MVADIAFKGPKADNSGIVDYVANEVIGSPPIDGALDVTAETAHIPGVSRFVDCEALKWKGSREMNVLIEAFEARMQIPPDMMRDHFVAFRSGGIAVLKALQVTEPDPAAAPVDIWAAAKDRFGRDFDADCPVGDELPFAAFRLAANQARKRHREFSTVADRLYDYYKDLYSARLGYSALCGVGFVLHQWDIVWDDTCAQISRSEAHNLDPYLFLN